MDRECFFPVAIRIWGSYELLLLIIVHIWGV